MSSRLELETPVLDGVEIPRHADSAAKPAAGGRGTPTSTRPDRALRAALFLILLCGAVLRLSAVGFGNHSLTFQPDEDSNITIALSLSSTRLNPHAFYYPALTWYALFALNRFVFSLGKEYGLFPDWSHYRAFFETIPMPFFLLGRTLSVAFGTATVGLVYLLGRRLFSPAHGLVAAAFLAGTFLHVRDSALATPDAPMTFFVVLSVLGATRVLQEARLRDYLLAGGAAGLATATKYNAVVVLVALVVAHGVRRARTGQPLGGIAAFPRLLGALLLAALLFFVLNPYVVLDWPKAREGLIWQWHYGQTGQYLDIGPAWRYHLTVSLRYGMGVVLLGLALAGVVSVLWRRAGWVLLSFAILFFAEMGGLRAIFVRYMTPLLPALCLFAAVTLLGLTERLAWPRARPWVTAGLLLLALAEPVQASLAYGRLVRQVDTRVQTYEFIRDTLPPDTKVATYGPSVTWRSTIPRFRPIMYPRSSEGWAATLATIETRNIHYLLIHHSELEVFSPTIPELEVAITQAGTLLREFSPYKPGVSPHPVYDRVDAHYFPIGGFRGVARPGPLVRLYRLE